MNQRPIVIIALLLSIVTSSACIYRMDIPQGNRIDAETVEKLEPGMSMRQVEFLLGAPAIKDPYHAKKWHYVYYLKRGGTGDVYKTVMTLHFTGGLLVQVEGSLQGELDLL